MQGAAKFKRVARLFVHTRKAEKRRRKKREGDLSLG